jgi:hypothetical protein
MGEDLSDSSVPLSTNMKTAIALLYIFIIAIVGALAVTLSSVSFRVQVIAIVSVTPILFSSFVFIYFCRKRRAWSFAGASILGALGVILRIVVSTQPNLEVGGGLPAGVTALYVVIGALVSLKNYEAFIELKQ